VASMDLMIADIKVAEDILQRAASTRGSQSRTKGGKRGRDGEGRGQSAAPEPTAVDGGDGSDAAGLIQALPELKAYLRTMVAVRELSRYLASGIDHKVSPSWAV
jgi:hypothetical protein